MDESYNEETNESYEEDELEESWLEEDDEIMYEIEMSDEDMPEKLVIAALLVKLVEKGKLGPEDADGLIEKYLG